MADTLPNPPIQVIWQSWITRDDLRANRDTIYVFGDNVAREGLRGLAREMRHEPNAHPISISWEPFRPFTPSTAPAAIEQINQDFRDLNARYPKTIVWPLSGLIPEFITVPDPIRMHLKKGVKTALGVTISA